LHNLITKNNGRKKLPLQKYSTPAIANLLAKHVAYASLNTTDNVPVGMS